MLVSLVAGILYFFNFKLYSVVVPNFNSISGGPVLFILSMIYVITEVLLFIGFVTIGKQQKNLLLHVTSFVIIVLIPTYVIVDSLARITGISIFIYLIRITVFLRGITGILFGTGLIKS